jgi:hypothetical protein
MKTIERIERYGLTAYLEMLGKEPSIDTVAYYHHKYPQLIKDWSALKEKPYPRNPALKAYWEDLKYKAEERNIPVLQLRGDYAAIRKSMHGARGMSRSDAWMKLKQDYAKRHGKDVDDITDEEEEEMRSVNS